MVRRRRSGTFFADGDHGSPDKPGNDEQRGLGESYGRFPDAVPVAGRGAAGEDAGAFRMIAEGRSVGRAGGLFEGGRGVLPSGRLASSSRPCGRRPGTASRRGPRRVSTSKIRSGCGGRGTRMVSSSRKGCRFGHRLGRGLADHDAAW